jgi:hypothetical protein
MLPDLPSSSVLPAIFATVTPPASTASVPPSPRSAAKVEPDSSTTSTSSF